MSNKEDLRHQQMMRTTDPQAPFDRCPALTTLLYQVCDKDQKKFDEAVRLIELFMDTAAKEEGLKY